ncbi:MAG: anhydro-N-acetylmuramic acid kinase, partial [Bacteroidetes bacterium]|nr:anhydro-N-acetylmuramic acid kinase [Bacteroidota bacterium]
GGGALNVFLVERISAQLKELSVEVVIPDRKLVNYKEALVMALMGVLRWREEYNVLASVTGASRNSINGALWMGHEA